MNKFSVKIQTVAADEEVAIDHMKFSNCCLVKIFIDGEDIGKLFLPHNEPLIFFEELERSTYTGGRYLIFTCVNEIADSGGWEGVSVFHNDLKINWEFDYDGLGYTFSFKKQDYIDEIKDAKVEIETSDYVLDPTNTVFPEAWGHQALEGGEFEPSKLNLDFPFLRFLSSILKKNRTGR